MPQSARTLAELAVMVSQAAVVPPYDDARGAGNTCDVTRNLQSGQELVRHPDIVSVAQIILQRLQIL
jgi:hypothetical protein